MNRVLNVLTPSKVSRMASSRKRPRVRAFVNVALSDNTSSIVDTTANGPFTSVRIAACGRYVKMNMNAVTPTAVVRVGSNFSTNGFHRLLCARK
jgi:hypothetical protein